MMKLIKEIELGISLVEKDNGVNKFYCHGILGETASKKYEEGLPIDLDVDGGEFIAEFFDTLPEAKAFWRGVNAMSGWLDFSPTDFHKDREFSGMLELNQVTDVKSNLVGIDKLPGYSPDKVLYWDDPDPIKGNDYRVSFYQSNGDGTALIQYSEGGSEAEVFETELTFK